MINIAFFQVRALFITLRSSKEYLTFIHFTMPFVFVKFVLSMIHTKMTAAPLTGTHAAFSIFIHIPFHFTFSTRFLLFMPAIRFHFARLAATRVHHRNILRRADLRASPSCVHTYAYTRNVSQQFRIKFCIFNYVVGASLSSTNERAHSLAWLV